MKMTEVTKQKQINKALEVLSLMNQHPDMRQEKACNQVGIDPKTYRKWIAEADDALLMLQEIRQDSERNQLLAYVIARDSVVDSLLKDVIKPGLPVKDRIKALEFINGQIDELDNRYHASDSSENMDLLTGPAQLPGESRMANHEVTVQENTKNDTIIVTVKNKQFIDGKIVDSSPSMENNIVPDSSR